MINNFHSNDNFFLINRQTNNFRNRERVSQLLPVHVVFFREANRIYYSLNNLFLKHKLGSLLLVSEIVIKGAY